MDIGEILIAARSRWLKPTEVCNILQNYEKYEFRLNQEPPIKPPSGSLYLFDRKVVRYFRKDGHNWRKKKDGKTVREAHEKLKAGSVDILHCYYAHGEENDLFQRRCYWLLDGVNENIVLVHYRTVAQGSGRTSHSPLSQSPLNSAPGSPRFLNGLSEEATADGSKGVSSQATWGNLQSSSGQSGNHSQYTTSVSQAQRQSSGAQLDEELDDDGSERSPSINNTNEENEENVSGSQQLLLDGGLHQQQGTNLLPGTPGFGDKVTWQPTGQPVRAQQMDTEVQLQGGEIISPSPLQQWNHSSFEAMLQSPGGGEDLFLEEGKAAIGGGVDASLRPWGLAIGKGLPNSAGRSVGYDDLQLVKSGLEPARLVQHLQQQQQPWQTLPVLNATDSTLQQSASSPQPAVGTVAAEALKSQFLEGTGPWLEHGGKGPGGPDSLLAAGPWSEDNQEALVDAPMEGDQASVAQILASEMQLPILKGPGTFSGGSMRQFGKNDSFGQWVNEMYDAEGRDPSPRSPKSPVSPHSPQDVKPPPGLARIPSAREQDAGQLPATSAPYRPQQQGMEVDDEAAALASVPGRQPETGSRRAFAVVDYSPTSCSCSGGAEVVIVGQTEAVGAAREGLPNRQQPPPQWGCRFGEVFVQAEPMAAGVLHCVAPPHAAGAVDLVVLSEGQICTPPLPFHYLPGAEGSTKVEEATQMDISDAASSLEVRLVRLLEQGAPSPMTMGGGSDQWSWLRALPSKEEPHAREYLLENLLQVLLRRQLATWLEQSPGALHGGARQSSGDRSPGVLHTVAGLGYSWALDPLLRSGISVNALDSSGRTPLHWAAAHGRESMVVALLAAGADPNIRAPAFGPEVVGSSPPAPAPSRGQQCGFTSREPGSDENLTAAEMASRRGHAGIAAYLAEVAIDASLSTMTLNESTQEQLAARSAGEAAVAAAAAVKREAGEPASLEEKQALTESLAAVRRAAEAAARIQAAFRRHCQRRQQSQQRWQMAAGGVMLANDKKDVELTEEQMNAVLAVRRIERAYRGVRNSREQVRKHAAATRIQQRFRGWRGRQNFLLVRDRIIRLQACVKGRIQRKQYQRMRWSMGILAKAVIRWRRKRTKPLLGGSQALGSGLEIFPAQQQQKMDSGCSSAAAAAVTGLGSGAPARPLEASDAALGVSLTQVQALVVSDEARAQYLRLRHARAHLQAAKDNQSTGQVEPGPHQTDPDIR